jgi:hypothetical protein
MQSKSSILFKVLLNRFHPGVGATYLKSLSQDEVNEITKQTTTSQDPTAVLTWPQDLIARTHYSWLAPVVQSLPHSLQAHAVAALPEPQASGLRSLLKLSKVPTILSPSIKAFLIGQLYRKWQPQEALPLQYLPPTQLSPLLSLSKAELVEAIELLAMHDLADAIRHIVDKKYLKAIYQCLTPQKLSFLRVCLHKKEKIAAPKLDIEKWDRSPNTLNNLLHRRGMLRFGKALCGQSPFFVWHLVHTLDTGRGTAISQHYRQEEIPGITPLLMQQVISLINFLKPKSDA